jgi:hypothetical protein
VREWSNLRSEEESEDDSEGERREGSAATVADNECA